jgi:hypothetical protein
MPMLLVLPGSECEIPQRGMTSREAFVAGRASVPTLPVLLGD